MVLSEFSKGIHERPSKEEEEFFILLGQPSRQIIPMAWDDSWENLTWVAETFHLLKEKSARIAHLKYRNYAAVVPMGKNIAIIAGGVIDNQVSDLVELFDCKRRLIRRVASLKFPRMSHGACFVEDDVVVCGGRQDTKNFKSCELYLRSENRWRQLPDMKEPRSGVMVVSLPDRRVFALGGYNSKRSEMRSVEGCLLPVDLSSLIEKFPSSFWRSVSPMRNVRGGRSAAAFEERIYVAGGSYLEVFTPPKNQNDKGQWCELSIQLSENRWYFPLVASASGIYTFEGDLSHNNDAEFVIFLQNPGNSIGQLNSIGNSVEKLLFEGQRTAKKGSSGTCGTQGSRPFRWGLLRYVEPMIRIWGAIRVSSDLLVDMH